MTDRTDDPMDWMEDEGRYAAEEEADWREAERRSAADTAWAVSRCRTSDRIHEGTEQGGYCPSCLQSRADALYDQQRERTP